MIRHFGDPGDSEIRTCGEEYSLEIFRNSFLDSLRVWVPVLSYEVTHRAISDVITLTT